MLTVSSRLSFYVGRRRGGGGGGVGAAGLNGITSAPRRILPRAYRKKSEYGATNNKNFFLISGKFNFCHFWYGLRKGRSAPPTSNLGDQTYFRLSLLSPTKEPQNSDAIAGYRHKADKENFREGGGGGGGGFSPEIWVGCASRFWNPLPYFRPNY